MRITEFPVLMEIKAEYIRFRQDGNSREEATQAMLMAYSDEVTMGAEDDGLLFWVGLADAQYSRKELSEEVAQKALAALDQIQNSDWNLCIGDLDRRRKKYAEAPMPERKVGKPRPPFHCGWQVGDTYAYQFGGPIADQLGLTGKYILFRTLYVDDFDGKWVPVVTFSFWEKKPFPQKTEEFISSPTMILRNGGRFSSPKHLFEYRAIIIFSNKRELESLALEYVGNFPDVPMPEDEIVFEDSGMSVLVSPKFIDRDVCLCWEYNNYYSPLVSPEDKREKYVILTPRKKA